MLYRILPGAKFHIGIGEVGFMRGYPLMKFFKRTGWLMKDQTHSENSRRVLHVKALKVQRLKLCLHKVGLDELENGFEI